MHFSYFQRIVAGDWIRFASVSVFVAAISVKAVGAHAQIAILFANHLIAYAKVFFCRINDLHALNFITLHNHVEKNELFFLYRNKLTKGSTSTQWPLLVNGVSKLLPFRVTSGITTSRSWGASRVCTLALLPVNLNTTATSCDFHSASPFEMVAKSRTACVQMSQTCAKTVLLLKLRGLAHLATASANGEKNHFILFKLLYSIKRKPCFMITCSIAATTTAKQKCRTDEIHLSPR